MILLPCMQINKNVRNYTSVPKSNTMVRLMKQVILSSAKACCFNLPIVYSVT